MSPGCTSSTSNEMDSHDTQELSHILSLNNGVQVFNLKKSSKFRWMGRYTCFAKAEKHHTVAVSISCQILSIDWIFIICSNPYNTLVLIFVWCHSVDHTHRTTTLLASIPCIVKSLYGWFAFYCRVYCFWCCHVVVDLTCSIRHRALCKIFLNTEMVDKYWSVM